MSDPDDDAALRWEGDDELGRMTSLDSPDRLRPERNRPARNRLEQEVDASDGVEGSTDVPPAVRPHDRALAVVTGMFAALFLAETVGWILVIQGVQAAGSFATGTGILDFLNGVARFLALIAAPLWFVAAVRLSTVRRIRIGWLALGLGALVPWPLLLGFVA